MPYGAQGGEGVAEGGEGVPAGKAGVSANNLPAVLPFSGRLHPGLDPEPEDLGAGCGEGGRGPEPRSSRVLSGSPPRGGGRARSGGPGSWRVGLEARFAGPAPATRPANWERHRKRVEPAL